MQWDELLFCPAMVGHVGPFRRYGLQDDGQHHQASL